MRLMPSCVAINSGTQPNTISHTGHVICDSSARSARNEITKNAVCSTTLRASVSIAENGKWQVHT